MPFQKGVPLSPKALAKREPRMQGTGISVAMTYQEIARAENISVSAVFRVERSALRKLREMPEARELFDVMRSLPTQEDRYGLS